MKDPNKTHHSCGEAFVFSIILIGTLLTRFYNYLLFHSIAELFTIIIAGGMFVIGWNSRRVMDNSFFLTLGISFLFIGFLDMLHTLSFAGMQIFIGFDTNLPTSLWVGARYLQAGSLLFALSVLSRKINEFSLLSGYFIICFLLVVSIFMGLFPACFIMNQGLTPFKIISEYVIILLLFIGLIWMYVVRNRFNSKIFLLMFWGVLMTMCSEFVFTLYTDAYAPTNAIGHLLKIVSFYLKYKAIIEIGVRDPFELLFQKLKHNEQALEQQNRELERTNKDLEMFSYSASHDMQEPLRKVTRYLSLLQEQSKDKLDPEAQEYLGIAIEGANRMKQMVGDLLEYARIGTRGIPFEKTDFETLLKLALTDLQIQLEDTKGQVMHDPLPTLLVDPNQMRQLFYNLISNALKFRGSIEPRVHISATQTDRSWVFSIKDNGIGIDMKQANRLFQLFQRLHSPVEYPGTGIGLALCKRIVERHGGRIWVESEVGKGSTFFFSIPLQFEPLSNIERKKLD